MKSRRLLVARILHLYESVGPFHPYSEEPIKSYTPKQIEAQLSRSVNATRFMLKEFDIVLNRYVKSTKERNAIINAISQCAYETGKLACMVSDNPEILDLPPEGLTS